METIQRDDAGAPIVVRLTGQEEELLRLRQDIVREDFTQSEAASLALAALPNPDPDFVAWFTR